MRHCERCGKEFPFWTRVDGTKRYLNSRRFCLDCSPAKPQRSVARSSHIQRECTGCKESKSEDNFYKSGRKTSCYCKSCANERKVKYDIELKKRAIAYKGGCCQRCGYKGHYAPFTFHHFGEKDMTWNMMRNSGWERVRKEIDKCDLLCANCHLIIHSREP